MGLGDRRMLLHDDGVHASRDQVTLKHTHTHKHALKTQRFKSFAKICNHKRKSWIFDPKECRFSSRMLDVNKEGVDKYCAVSRWEGYLLCLTDTRGIGEHPMNDDSAPHFATIGVTTLPLGL